MDCGCAELHGVSLDPPNAWTQPRVHAHLQNLRLCDLRPAQACIERPGPAVVHLLPRTTGTFLFYGR